MTCFSLSLASYFWAEKFLCQGERLNFGGQILRRFEARDFVGGYWVLNVMDIGAVNQRARHIKSGLADWSQINRVQS